VVATIVDEEREYSLRFAHSESLRLHFGGPFAEWMEEHAAQVVGGLRAASIISLPLTGVVLALGTGGMAAAAAAAAAAAPLFMHSALVLGSEAVLLLFGKKGDVQKHAADENGQEPNALGKIVQPHKYPLQASAALDIMGEVSHIWYGVERFMAGDASGAVELAEEAVANPHDPHGFAPEWAQNMFEGHDHGAHAPGDMSVHGHSHTGYTPIIHGVLGVAAHLPLLLGRSHKPHSHLRELTGDSLRTEITKESEQSLRFGSSESKAVGAGGGLIEWVKDNPVAVASTLQFAMAAAMLVGGLLEMMPGYIVAGALLATAAVIQGVFVKKHEYAPQHKGEGEQAEPDTHVRDIEHTQERVQQPTHSHLQH